MEVVNLFAYRTSKPSLLKQAAEPIGKDNDRFILESVERCDRVILAWGNHGTWQKQDLYILELLKNYNHLYSLGMTKLGYPRHPRRAEWLRASLTRLAAKQPALRRRDWLQSSLLFAERPSLRYTVLLYRTFVRIQQRQFASICAVCLTCFNQKY